MQERKAGSKLRTNRKIIKKTAKRVTKPNMESYCATDFGGESVTNTSALGLMPGESSTPLNITQMSELPLPHQRKYSRLTARLFKNRRNQSKQPAPSSSSPKRD